MRWPTIGAMAEREKPPNNPIRQLLQESRLVEQKILVIQAYTSDQVKKLERRIAQANAHAEERLKPLGQELAEKAQPLLEVVHGQYQELQSRSSRLDLETDEATISIDTQKVLSEARDIGLKEGQVFLEQLVAFSEETGELEFEAGELVVVDDFVTHNIYSDDLELNFGVYHLLGRERNVSVRISSEAGPFYESTAKNLAEVYDKLPVTQKLGVQYALLNAILASPALPPLEGPAE